MTRPNGPATATSGSASAATSGVTRSSRGSTLVSSSTTTGAAARRIPQFSAAACPSLALVRTTSTVTAAGSGSDVVTPARACSCSGDGPFATTTTCVPAGDVARSASSARETSAGQSVATRTTVATPTGASSSRDGTDALDPYRSTPAIDDVRGRRPLQGVQRGRVEHLPAGGLDLRPEGVGGLEVAGAPGGSAGVRERADLVGDVIGCHRREDTGRGSAASATSGAVSCRRVG